MSAETLKQVLKMQMYYIRQTEMSKLNVYHVTHILIFDTLSLKKLLQNGCVDGISYTEIISNLSWNLSEQNDGRLLSKTFLALFIFIYLLIY